MMRGVSACSSWKSIQNPTLFASGSLHDWSWSRAEQARLGYFPLLAEKNIHPTIYSNSKSKTKEGKDQMARLSSPRGGLGTRANKDS
jgi:hypothetical protein